MKSIGLVILGATGSIGQSTLSVWRQHRDRIKIDGLVAQSRREALWGLGVEMQARWIALTDPDAADLLRLDTEGLMGPRIISGDEAIRDAIRSSPATHTLAAMSGFAGLEPTLTALECGMTVLLANKETLVAAGDLVRRTAREYHGALVPVDSEHSAIFQCLALPQPIRRLVLTCSGGPFRGRTLSELESVAVEDALRHPNWSMGPKITIDSATLMNKGLEVIEAHHLFEVSYDQVDVVIHPQSIVHSMVEFQDGSTLAQLGWPDMRIPIEVALAWPERWPLDVAPMPWTGKTLEFEEPDTKTFRALHLAREAGRQGGLYPTVLNASNEVAVAGFLAGTASFLSIAAVVEETLSHFHSHDPVENLGQVLQTDAWARREAQQIMKGGIFKGG